MQTEWQPRPVCAMDRFRIGISPLPTATATRLIGLSPWLKLLGALLAFLLISLFTAVHSELGNQISAGESYAFSWVRTHVGGLLRFGLAYLLIALGIQHLGFRLSGRQYPRGMLLLAGGEVVAVGILALANSRGFIGVIPWSHLFLQVSLFLQILLTLGWSSGLEPGGAPDLLDQQGRSPLLFLALLFLFGAAPAYFDPSWNRLQDHVGLESTFEIFLSHTLPPILSGVTALWFGAGIWFALAGLQALQRRLDARSRLQAALSLLTFFFLSGLWAVLLLLPLSKTIDWELSSLHLKGAIAPLLVLLWGGGGALTYAAFRRLVPCASLVSKKCPIGMVSLSIGAALFFPLTWMLTRSGVGRRSWQMVLASTFVGIVLLGSYVLYGGLFDPWFTALSYLKGALLKTAAVVAAGTLALILEEIVPAGERISPARRRQWVGVGAMVLAGFLPFSALESSHGAKAVILQFNELSQVDAAYARELSRSLEFERWIRLGQNPKTNGHPHPWPLPWSLKKTGPSFLPKDFNLIVIVVDALRGDAFHSAGYHRNLTPFLDRWALEEAVSFSRAYSQGGGTFAAFPFLIAGRSRLDLYGLELYRENLYYKLAEAEGIQKFMMVKGGPRAIFPPDVPLIELGGTRVTSGRRSVPADEVFGWAREAIGALGKGERFFSFLLLMDVHNDLWKKHDGLDFGDSPRDLYDNNLSYVDRAFQRFATWLKQRGLYDRTVILLTSDHGEQFWEHGASLHGHTLFEEEIRIPLILLAHGLRARIEDVPALAADMAPTLIGLAGYSVHPPYDDPHMGISLVPLLLGKERDRYLKRDVVGRASFKRRYFLYRNWEWKLVYSAELDLLQLFNTVEDPGEKTNFLQRRRELAAELERELFGYLERVEGKTYRALLSGTRVSSWRSRHDSSCPSVARVQPPCD